MGTMVMVEWCAQTPEVKYAAEKKKNNVWRIEEKKKYS